ncbi:hypothetical protein LINPERPRIM_LOCUS6009 [Linum perenne]
MMTWPTSFRLDWLLVGDTSVYQSEDHTPHVRPPVSSRMYHTTTTPPFIERLPRAWIQQTTEADHTMSLATHPTVTTSGASIRHSSPDRQGLLAVSHLGLLASHHFTASIMIVAVSRSAPPPPQDTATPQPTWPAPQTGPSQQWSRQEYSEDDLFRDWGGEPTPPPPPRSHGLRDRATLRPPSATQMRSRDAARGGVGIDFYYYYFAYVFCIPQMFHGSDFHILFIICTCYDS